MEYIFFDSIYLCVLLIRKFNSLFVISKNQKNVISFRFLPYYFKKAFGQNHNKQHITKYQRKLVLSFLDF